MPSAASNTVYSVISDAMRDAGILRRGQLPDSQAISDYARDLSDIINLWQTQGLKLFLWEEITIPLVAGQGLYELGPTGDVVMPKPLNVLQGFVLNPQGIRRPLVGLSWDEWMTLSQVTGNDGTISSYFVDKQTMNLKVHLWNTPNATEATNVAVLLCRTQAPLPVNLEESTQFPPEWRIALRWALADQLCTGQPEAIMYRCSKRATEFREKLENFDVEDVPTQFQPDQRGQTDMGGFV